MNFDGFGWIWTNERGQITAVVGNELIRGRTEDPKIHLLRAMVSSFVAFGVDFGIMIFLVEVAHIHYIVSATVGFLVGTTITYLLSILWIFPHRRLSRRSVEYGVFIAIGAVGVGLNDAFLWFFTEQLGVYYIVSRLLSSSIVFFWNFLTRKFLLFKPTSRAAN